MSMIENLEKIKKLGIKEFLRNEKNKMDMNWMWWHNMRP